VPEQDETHETPDQSLLENSAEDLYEHAPCGYLSTLPDGTIAKVNQTLLTWTGYRRDDLVGRRRFQDLLPAGGRIYHETHYAPLLRMQGTVREIALEVVRADGRRLPVLVNSDVKRDAAGEPLLIRTTVFDATDRRKYERELLLARNRERAARERTERLARITTVLAGALDRRQIAVAIIAELTESIAGDRAALGLLDDERRLEVVASHGWDAADLETWLFHLADPETVATSALLSREPRFYDAAEGSRPMPVTIPAEQKLGALAVLPLVVGGRSIGLLSLGFTAARQLSEEDRAFMVASASQCAQAVVRVQLHEQTTRAARRWAFLAETSSALDESQEFVRRAQRLVDVVVSRIADVACVEIAEDGNRTAVALASRDEGMRARSLGKGGGAGPLMDAAVAKAVASGKPQLLLGPSANGSDEQRSGARSVPLSFAALPLRVRGRVLGALTLSSFEPERRFGPDDTAFLSGLADRAALALENARLYEQERTVAHTLQRSLLPGDPPPDPRFHVATKYRPAVETLEVGGDWYDTFPVTDGTIGIVVGDVVGRGIQAASAMGQVRSAMRALAGAWLGPARLVERLDAFVEQVKTARWATLAYAEIELDTGRTRFACAGHPPPMLAQPTDPPRLLWEGRSTPLGTLPGLPARSEADLTLQPGARLLLYTDGLFERRHRSLDEGLDRLVEEFDRRRDAPLSTLIDGLTEAMLADEEGHDDVCLLCLSFGAPPPSEPRPEKRIAEAAPAVPKPAATAARRALPLAAAPLPAV
jgi:serine/threonine-protein kinase RsbW